VLKTSFWIRLDSFKNKVVSLHPDTPTYDDNDLREEWYSQLKFELLKCVKWVVKSNKEPYSNPTSPREWAVDEEMCQSFIHCKRATHTSILRKDHSPPSKQLSGT